MMRIKICGITRYRDAITAIEAGADAIGFIFAKSKRMMTPIKCREILEQLPPFAYTVGVFKDNSEKEINDILSICPLSALQFHGEEKEDFCHSFKRPVIKAISITKKEDVNKILEYQNTPNILLDSKTPGSGKTFDHKILNSLPPGKNIILAGGLTVENVSEIVNKYQVYALDVASGVEESPGIKSREKIIKFIKNARGLK